MTKSSVNFKALKSALHAVSHSTRTVAPTYLLPKDKSMGTIVLLDDKGSVASTLEAKLALASRQALREKNYSPLWEGILNLPRSEVGFDPDEYKKTCTTIVSSWCDRYEASTGHKVLRADVHLDEGHMVDGEALLNAHAHVISDRTNDKGRVMQLSPKMLRELQTLTSEVTGLERGTSSLQTGRKHISHQAYKYLAELGRLETQQQKVVYQKELDKAQAHVELSGKQVDTNIKAARSAIKKQQETEAELVLVKQQLAESLSREAEYKAARQALEKAHEEPLTIPQKLKKEKKNDTRQHPKFSKEPTGVFEMRDLWGVNNLHDLQHFEDLLQQDAPDHLRPEPPRKAHSDLQQLDPPGPQVALLEEALAKLAIAQEQAEKVPKLEADLAASIQQVAQLKERYRLDREQLGSEVQWNSKSS